MFSSGNSSPAGGLSRCWRKIRIRRESAVSIAPATVAGQLSHRHDARTVLAHHLGHRQRHLDRETAPSFGPARVEPPSAAAGTAARGRW